MATDVIRLFAGSITHRCCLSPRNSYLERPLAFWEANVRPEYAEELDRKTQQIKQHIET